MKLKKNFMVEVINDAPILVDSTGKWSGIVKCSKSMSIVIEKLQLGYERETIIEDLCKIFDAPKEVITMDFDEVISKLQSIGAIE